MQKGPEKDRLTKRIRMRPESPSLRTAVLLSGKGARGQTRIQLLRWNWKLHLKLRESLLDGYLSELLSRSDALPERVGDGQERP